jgi:RimJ/RimL family protein N-acetyltransferase
MDKSEKNIPTTTLETLARNFFKETANYGFKKVDYVRFVNMLLELSINHQEDAKEKGSRKQNRQLQSIRLPLKGKRIQIRDYEPKKDKSHFERWLKDEYGRYFLLSCTTAKKLKLEQLLRTKSNIMGVIILPENQPIGAVAYLNHDPTQHKAELRKLIGEPHMRRMGLAKEATALWVLYGLSTLNLKKIYLNTLDTNMRNIRLNEELGFKVEGILHKEVLIDGEYRDVLRMGLWHRKQKVRRIGS